MRSKGILLAVVTSLILQNLSFGFALSDSAFGAGPGSAVGTGPRNVVNGTELGNARFVPYANSLYGISFEYPERWNLVDTGASVSVVATSPGFSSVHGLFEEISSSNLDVDRHIGIYFDESQYFSTNVAFDRYVKRFDEGVFWMPTQFLNRFAFETRSDSEVRIVVLKDNSTAMHLSYPLETNGMPSELVKRTVSSLKFGEK